MNVKRERMQIVIAGLIIGVIASLLVFFGNPANMGFCIACFLRDTAGGLGLHRAAAVQYIRPEIIGLVLGSFGVALIKKEFSAKGGSAPVTRFMLGFFVMIGCLMFLGCPFRMILRLAGGDLNALLGLLGFVLGILAGVFFLKRGYSLKRTYAQSKLDGIIFPVIQVVVFILLVAAPAFIFFTEAGGGPGAKHAAIAISLIAGLIVGALAQRTRLCMVGGIRDVVLFREPKLLMGFGAILVSALICNLILTAATGTSFFHLGFAEQPIAHTDGLWNCLGMLLVGFGCVLLGGCPLRQLILAGSGNGDSAVTVFGMIVGAAFAHNFALAGNPDSANDAGEVVVGGIANAGKVAVVIGFVVLLAISLLNSRKEAAKV